MSEEQKYNIQMRKYNKDTDAWDILYPYTKADNVLTRLEMFL